MRQHGVNIVFKGVYMTVYDSVNIVYDGINIVYNGHVHPHSSSCS